MNLLDDTDHGNERSEIEAKWADKSKEEILKAKIESDLYIKTLEKRADDLRPDYLRMQSELQDRASMQELRDQIAELQKLNSETPPAKEVAPFDHKQIESLVSSSIAREKQADKEANNFNMVKNKLIEKHGANHQAFLNSQMDELGLTPEKLNERARTEPQLLIKALGLNDTTRSESFQSPPRSGQRMDTFAPKGQVKRDWNYYQELKKTNPKLYLDPKIAVQMHDDAIALGDAFGL